MKELERYRRVHLAGIGGAGMSAIALVLAEQGFDVSGSDIARSQTTQRLERFGIEVSIGHAAENVAGAELLISSTAIGPDNPERIEAERLGLPIWRRAKALAEIMRGGKGLAVSGTHGKTTTTAMISVVMADAGLEPTILIGGDYGAFGGNARSGSGDWVVAEADESDASFLDMDPDLAIVTNVEADHLDFYRDLDHVAETFASFLGRIRPGGKAIVCIDSPAAAALVAGIEVATLTYSTANREADLFAAEIRHLSAEGLVRFDAVHCGKNLGEIRLAVPGHHNVANAAAALLAGLEIGVPFESIRDSLAGYTGVKRRFEIKGTVGGVTVIDDYAHHPTEIRATLEGARASHPGPGRIAVVFQPHRYSRTQSLAGEFGPAFAEADLLIVTDVYGAGEAPIEGVSGATIHEQVLASGHPNVHYIPERSSIIEFLTSELRRGDRLFTLGAGDVWSLGESILENLRSGETPPAVSEGRPVATA